MTLPDDAEELLEAYERMRDAPRRVWREMRHPHQIPPDGDWSIWMMVTGRGAGKTRGAAQVVAETLIDTPGWREAVVAPTWSETRHICLFGPSGLLPVLRGLGQTPHVHKSDGIITLSNGSQAIGYSSEKPDRLRGPEHHGAWCEELAVWRDAWQPAIEVDTTWSNLRLGLRLGDRTRTIITTTPKRVQLLRDLLEAGYPVSRAPSRVNLANVSDDFASFIASLEGTRLGRQEVEGEMLEMVEGALWEQAWIDGNRHVTQAKLKRVVTGVDPAGGRTGVTGIVTVARADTCDCGTEGAHGQVLADDSVSGDPLTWAQAVCDAARKWGADIVAERNYGGEMVESTIRQVWPQAPVKLIVAKGGVGNKSAKAARAEPVAALYQAGRVHHGRPFIGLEDQLTGWTPDDKWSPDRLDALVHAVTALDLAGPPRVASFTRPDRIRR